MSDDPSLLALLRLRHPTVSADVLAERLREAVQSLTIIHGDAAHPRVLSLASDLIDAMTGRPRD